ncbi:nucleotidyltransferase [Formosimonas limnophila]|uniref:Nucleotidyltransferase n=1 Tax=Formosimonas limnophila TaxID=1384487 RepID=A0A8J3CM72_9BURK|nr:nucleotidyltransferase substrate binding protein [Formosimonas limnophila]GHA65368.1 nucleotidyltransferase [Formosimonas limnophila]
MTDIRWKQRFNNFIRAFGNLQSAIVLSNQRALSDLEKQGLIQAFEFTHELAWNVLKDYLEEQGFTDIIGSKNAARKAFNQNLVRDGQAWMDMVDARNKTVHAYRIDIATEVYNDIVERFYPAFNQFKDEFNKRYEQE